jgi:hypothetical protein
MDVHRQWASRLYGTPSELASRTNTNRIAVLNIQGWWNGVVRWYILCLPICFSIPVSETRPHQLQLLSKGVSKVVEVLLMRLTYEVLVMAVILSLNI